jgi:hypothetical protein
VLLTRDPITTKKFTGGKHVGKTVYLSTPPFPYIGAFWSKDEHEPERTRNSMLNSLEDSRIPGSAWRYREMAELNPAANETRKGSLEEYEKLKQAVIRYHRRTGEWFDYAGFERDFKIFRELLQDK